MCAKEGEAGAGLLDDILDAEQHVLPDGIEVVPFVRPGINSNVEVERRRAVADKPHPDGFAVDPRVAVEHLADLREDMAQLVRVSLVTQADGLCNQHLIAACPVDDLHVGELGIGHRNQSPVEALIWMERTPMVSTVPLRSPKVQKSPTRMGWSR